MVQLVMDCPQAADWSREHLDAAGETADECEENIDAVVGQYQNEEDTIAKCHKKYAAT